MRTLDFIRNIFMPHLWLTKSIFGIDDAALFAGGGALLGGLFGGSEDEGDPAVTGFSALPFQLQQQLLGAASTAEQQATPNEFFPGQTFADLTPEQLSGLESQLGFAGGLQPTIENIFGSFNQGINPDTVNDPAVQAALNSMENRANTNFFENIVPGLRRGGTSAGQGFGTRPELAAGVAGSKLNQDILNAQGTFLGNQLASARALQGNLLGNAGNILSTGLLPGQIEQNVGGVFQGQEQQQINEDIARFDFGQNAESAALNQLIQQLGAIGNTGGSSSITPGQNTGVSTISAALAGGALGNLAGEGVTSAFPNLFRTPAPIQEGPTNAALPGTFMGPSLR